MVQYPTQSSDRLLVLMTTPASSDWATAYSVDMRMRLGRFTTVWRLGVRPARSISVSTPCTASWILMVQWGICRCSTSAWE